MKIIGDKNEVFIKKAIKKHGNKYNYSKVEYVDSKTDVCIICPEHGEFWQSPNHHLSGHGCKMCGGTLTHTNETFAEKANKIHNYRYDYSKVKYINNKTKVCIICPEHGEFWQKPNLHLSGKGCYKCNGGVQITSGEFVNSAKKIHFNRYDYSKVNYVNTHTEVCIICPEHGEFWQKPNVHLSGHGCQMCANINRRSKNRMSQTECLTKFYQTHKDKYIYSNVSFFDTHTRVCIVCPSHGEFWQLPYDHINGHGCPKCNCSLLEKDIRDFLLSNDIIFKEQYRQQWLGLQSLDFYLPDYKVGIECQGIQHFSESSFFGGKDGLNRCMERDSCKLEKCQDNGVKLLYYSNLHIDYPYDVFEDKDKLLEEILKNGKVCN